SALESRCDPCEEQDLRELEDPHQYIEGDPAHPRQPCPEELALHLESDEDERDVGQDADPTAHGRRAREDATPEPGRWGDGGTGAGHGPPQRGHHPYVVGAPTGFPRISRPHPEPYTRWQARADEGWHEAQVR